MTSKLRSESPENRAEQENPNKDGTGKSQDVNISMLQSAITKNENESLLFSIKPEPNV